MNRLLPALFLLVTCSCINVESRKVSVFYNVDSLVDAQVASLAEVEATLVKSATIEEGTEQTEQTPDAEQWERELNVFRTIDINKPRLVPLYTSTTEYDMNGIAVTTYESLEPDATVVRRIQYRMDQGELLSLEAEMSDKKPIYSNKRILGMKFAPSENGPMLTSYFIRGGEQLRMKDSIRYELNARIEL